MKIKKGRDFSTAFPSDSSAIIINEKAAKRLGLGSDPIGKKINSFNGPADVKNAITWTVIGVVDDFHFSSMKESISALSLVLGKSDGSICFRFKPNQTAQVIASLETIWQRLAPGQPFQYSLLDEDFSQMYFAEQRLGKIFTLFAGLAIVIACLGLFALTAFTAEQRTKEIGIRKVMGASVRSIVILLSREFGKLIIMAFFIAVPIAWFAIGWWLKSYTYKVEIGWIVYASSGTIAMAIALLTMSFQSIKAATSDPVKSLRSE
jgi:putative ABC transport system permease protein